jgi:hypothetical protein
MSASPTFVARFEDGTETRMSVFSSREQLDVARGIAIARAAYSSRKRIPLTKSVSRIVSGHFEDDEGAVLATYDAEQLANAERR